VHHWQDGWGSWPRDGDPLGVASARLLALGVERRERLAVLRFLGILLDHAGARGVVRAAPAVIAAEFRLDPVDVGHWVSLLREVRVLAEEDGHLRIEGFEHHRSTGLPDGEALAIIGSVLDTPPDSPAGIAVPDLIDLTGTDATAGAPAESVAEAPAEPAAEPAPAHQVAHDVSYPPPEDIPDTEPEPERVLVGAGVGGPSAGSEPQPAPGSGVRARRPGGIGPGGRHRAPVTSVLALLTGLVLVVAGVFARPGSEPVDVTDLAAGPVTTIEVPASLPGSFVPSTSPSQTAPLAPAGPDDIALADPAAADAPATPPPPSSPTPIAAQATPCPDLVPAVSGVVTRVEPLDLEAVLGTSPWVVVVEGAVVGGAEPATVSSLPVRVALADGSQISAEALTAAVTVAPGRMVRWEMRAQTASIAAPEVTTVTAGPPVSRWLDPARAAACPIA
jgi:hypothetical protein